MVQMRNCEQMMIIKWDAAAPSWQQLCPFTVHLLSDYTCICSATSLHILVLFITSERAITFTVPVINCEDKTVGYFLSTFYANHQPPSYIICWWNKNNPYLKTRHKRINASIIIIVSLIIRPWPWSDIACLYLDPRPSVILGSSPSIDQALPVEACKVGVPFLQAEESTVGRWGCYLLVGDYATLHAQWSRAFWGRRGGGGDSWAFSGNVKKSFDGI